MNALPIRVQKGSSYQTYSKTPLGSWAVLPGSRLGTWGLMFGGEREEVQ